MSNQNAVPEHSTPANPARGQDVAGTEILNVAALDGIRALQKPNKPNLLEKIVGFYLADAPRLIKTMADAVAGADCDAVQRAAHALKSSSANLGAVRLAQLCREMEEEARTGSLASAPVRMTGIEQEYAVVHPALAACTGVKTND